MTDTPNRSTATTARRPDCVTEVRRGNSRPCHIMRQALIKNRDIFRHKVAKGLYSQPLSMV